MGSRSRYPALYSHQYILCSLLWQVSSTVDDEEEDLPQYSTSHSQTYYSGLPTSSPPPALNNIFISAGDEKSIPVQSGSPDNGDVEIEQLDLEAQVCPRRAFIALNFGLSERLAD